jgi:hypothetical protein
LNRQSMRSIYFGINYIIAIPWVVDKSKELDFQKALHDQQLDFPEVKSDIRSLTLIRKEQSYLEVRIASLGPQVSSIIVRSEAPSYELDFFAKEANAVYAAYQQSWINQQCHILRCDTTIRHLYSCGEHAFKYLWETRLGQKGEDFHHLGKRHVLGGGLRLVIPPIRDEAEPTQIEIKIESFLQESLNMFIETLFVWPQPRLLAKDSKFDPEFRLKRVEKYATNEVWNFLLNPKIED